MPVCLIACRIYRQPSRYRDPNMCVVRPLGWGMAELSAGRTRQVAGFFRSFSLLKGIKGKPFARQTALSGPGWSVPAPRYRCTCEGRAGAGRLSRQRTNAVGVLGVLLVVRHIPRHDLADVRRPPQSAAELRCGGMEERRVLCTAQGRSPAVARACLWAARRVQRRRTLCRSCLAHFWVAGNGRLPSA